MNNYELSPRSGNAFIAVGDSPRIMCDSARFREQGRAPYVPARVANLSPVPSPQERGVFCSLPCGEGWGEVAACPGHRGLSPTAIYPRALRALPSDTFLTECFHRAKRIYHCLCLGLIILGCDTRRDIVDDHGVWVRVEVDWTQVGMRPEGTSIYVFSQETGNRTAVLLTNEMRDGMAFDSVRLHIGHYSLLAFNNTERSHGSLSFRGTDRYHTAEAYANPITPPAGDRYAPHATAQAAVAMAATEVLAAAHLDHFEVDYEMIRSQSRPLLRLVPERCTIAIAVTAHVQHMRSLHTGATPIGALTGMAESVYLATGNAGAEPATHWFALPPATFDNASNSGTLKAEFAAFNVPAETTVPNLLPLYLLLCDGSPCDSERDVTALLRDNVDESRLAIDIALELPETPCHGFDAGTNPWDDENVIEVPVKN